MHYESWQNQLFHARQWCIIFLVMLWLSSFQAVFAAFAVSFFGPLSLPLLLLFKLYSLPSLSSLEKHSTALPTSKKETAEAVKRVQEEYSKTCLKWRQPSSKKLSKDMAALATFRKCSFRRCWVQKGLSTGSRATGHKRQIQGTERGGSQAMSELLGLLATLQGRI